MALVAACLAIVIFFSDSPILLFRFFSKNKNFAALAIRDNVIPFQKFGSRLFTVPYLDKAYGEVVYLTEFERNAKKSAFIENLSRLLGEYDQVDLYLLAHANDYYLWVAQIDGALRKKLRLVYNTGCSGASQGDTWLQLGARSYVSHASAESLSPVFYFFFLRRWCAGSTLSEATHEANINLKTRLSRLGADPGGGVLEGSCGTCFGRSDYKIHE